MVFAPAYRRGDETDIPEGSLKQAKIINMGEHSFVVTVELAQKNDPKIQITIKIYHSGTRHLPLGLLVTVLYQNGEEIEKVEITDKETDSVRVLHGLAEPDENFIVAFNLSGVTNKEKFSGK